MWLYSDAFFVLFYIIKQFYQKVYLLNNGYYCLLLAVFNSILCDFSFINAFNVAKNAFSVMKNVFRQLIRIK